MNSLKLDVLLTHSWPGQTGGGTVDVLGLRDGLERRGHHAAVIERPRALRAELDHRERALVHVFGCVPAYAPAAALIAAKRRGRAVVWTPVFHPSRGGTWKGYGWRRVMQVFDAVAPRAARLVDAVIAATEAEARYFASLGAARVELIPPGVDRHYTSVAGGELERFRSRFGLNGAPVVLTVARENSRKALPFGINAFRLLRERRPDATLLLVGADPVFLRDEPGVRCTGWLDRRDVELAYRSSDLLFVPSVYEGLPRAVIEAWSFGLPVVATDRVALAPTIDGVGGRVIRYGEAGEAATALATVLADARLAHAYGEAGRRLTDECFRLERSIELTESLYQDLVA
jgi:glycosyltransferase involved in cell wall biosynthesis